MFTGMGAEAYAERARLELLATGERARPQSAPAAGELTQQGRRGPAVAGPLWPGNVAASGVSWGNVAPCAGG